MDELIAEFLTETNESLEFIDVELVRFEQDLNNTQTLGRRVIGYLPPGSRTPGRARRGLTALRDVEALAA